MQSASNCRVFICDKQSDWVAHELDAASVSMYGIAPRGRDASCGGDRGGARKQHWASAASFGATADATERRVVSDGAGSELRGVVKRLMKVYAMPTSVELLSRLLGFEMVSPPTPPPTLAERGGDPDRLFMVVDAVVWRRWGYC